MRIPPPSSRKRLAGVGIAALLSTYLFVLLAIAVFWVGVFILVWRAVLN